jgi:hypothetical protein
MKLVVLVKALLAALKATVKLRSLQMATLNVKPVA